LSETLSLHGALPILSSEKSWWPGVSSRLITQSRYSICITDEATEIPRCFSISIQSDEAWRLALRALTLPAIWIAPANSNSFSVRVVLPASGWEMMANVRRRATSSDRLMDRCRRRTAADSFLVAQGRQDRAGEDEQRAEAATAPARVARVAQQAQHARARRSIARHPRAVGEAPGRAGDQRLEGQGLADLQELRHHRQQA